MYGASENRLFIAVAQTSWKRADQDGSVVALTVPIWRGGILPCSCPSRLLWVSFSSRASVYPAARCGPNRWLGSTDA